MRRSVRWLKHITIAHPRLALLLRLLPVYIVFWLVCWRRLDPDFGWHLQTGNYIRAHGIPMHDIFTYTARNFAWIDHEWGSDVLVSFVYQFSGFWGLTSLFAAIWTAALALAGLRARFTLLLAALIAVYPYVAIRPYAWTILFLAILVGVLRAKPSRLVFALPALFLVWANLHGGFIVGLAIVGFWIVRYKRLDLLWLFIPSVLVTLINPYGPRLYEEVWRTLFDGALHSQVREWNSFSIPAYSWPFIGLWAIGFWHSSRRSWRQWLTLEPVLFIAMFSATRYVPLFVVGALRTTDPYSTWVHLVLQKIRDTHRRFIMQRAAGTASFVLILLFLLVIVIQPLNREAAYPAAAVTYLQAHSCRGAVFNSFDYGGYLIWRLPGVPVYIDGRMPTWRNSDGVRYMDIYAGVLRNSQAMHDEFVRYGVRCALLQSGEDRGTITRLKAVGWSSVINKNGAMLLLAP